MQIYFNGGRPYSGTYIFITDSLGYASGYSDGEKLFTYTIPFSEDKLFSIKNPKHLAMMRKYIDAYTITQIQKTSGDNQEIDWASLSYIGTDEFEDAVDLFQHLGFYGIRLKERQDIESIYIFDESKLIPEGEIDLKSPEVINQIGQFYKDFTKDKNFLEEDNEPYCP